jgi:hypothetical protein
MNYPKITTETTLKNGFIFEIHKNEFKRQITAITFELDDNSKNVYATVTAHPDDIFDYHKGSLLAINKCLRQIKNNYKNEIIKMNKKYKLFEYVVHEDTQKMIKMNLLKG